MKSKEMKRLSSLQKKLEKNGELIFDELLEFQQLISIRLKSIIDSRWEEL